ncbi:MAG TPA: hypothetical protein VFV87_17725, partial [Pirellulaceae bacterium]|nr:hypothetical protein [Pirellulaceae bacterium]
MPEVRGTRGFKKLMVSVACPTVSMIPLSRSLLTAWVCVGVVLWGSPALGQDRAQDNPTRFEIGAGFATLWQHSESGAFARSPGLSVSFGVPLARHLALETELAWFPGSAPGGFKDQGGQALQF